MKLSSSNLCQFDDLPITLKSFIFGSDRIVKEYILQNQIIILKNGRIRIFIPTVELVRKLFVEKGLYADDVLMPDQISDQVLYYKKDDKKLEIHLSNECNQVSLTKSKVMLLARRLLCHSFSAAFDSIYNGIADSHGCPVKPISIVAPESKLILSCSSSNYKRFADNIFISQLDICRHKEPLPISSISVRHRGHYYQFSAFQQAFLIAFILNHFYMRFQL